MAPNGHQDVSSGGAGSIWISDSSKGAGKGWALEEYVLFCRAEDQNIIGHLGKCLVCEDPRGKSQRAA